MCIDEFLYDINKISNRKLFNAFKNTGVGRITIKWLIGFAKYNKSEYIILESTEHVYEFYKKQGFVKNGDYYFYNLNKN